MSTLLYGLKVVDSMKNSVIDTFIGDVVYDHSKATGLKLCTTDQEIVDYAASLGFCFDIQDWENYISADLSELTPAQQDVVNAVDPNHWSWAFRRVKAWRAMLMDGA